MPKKTIAQMRYEQVLKLADIITAATGADTDSAADQAAHLMNRYYRLCGADERLLYLENDERTANRRSTQELSEQTEKRLESLQADFKKIGLKLTYFGYLPTITDFNNNTVIYSYFYQY